MSRIGVASDSTCDLSKELTDQYDVSILPLHVILDDKEYLDGVEISSTDIYEWSDRTKKTPKTSAFSPEEAEEFLKHLRKKIHFDPREYHVEGFNAEEGTAQINSREWNSMSLERYRWKIATLIMALEQDK